ncbi:hypothetical protein bb8_p16 [Bordetella phage vB_BbrP_BB8]|uniref:Uncharacterized protein n=1 Tax=Bordetella phage vB_BbrP_BB8 TaxID=2587820 RepID=A0A4Y5TQY2_9CAUD|nr:hypothetical protein bb8_p16 [Bordetella phage vB_BbrP_BB8]
MRSLLRRVAPESLPTREAPGATPLNGECWVVTGRTK